MSYHLEIKDRLVSLVAALAAAVLLGTTAWVWAAAKNFDYRVEVAQARADAREYRRDREAPQWRASGTTNTGFYRLGSAPSPGWAAVSAGTDFLRLTSGSQLQLGTPAPGVVCDWPAPAQPCGAGAQPALSTVLFADGTWRCEIGCRKGGR